MKKLICVLMALTMLLAFAACGEKEDKKPTITDGTEATPTIFTVVIIHGDGEESTSRMTSEKETLAEALIERTIMTEDMLTVGGEKADPADNAYWTLYINGVYATEPWDEIKIEGGAEYMFEYTVDMEYEDVPDDEIGDEGPAEDEIVEETEPEIPDTSDVVDPEV